MLKQSILNRFSPTHLAVDVVGRGQLIGTQMSQVHCSYYGQVDGQIDIIYQSNAGCGSVKYLLCWIQ